MNDRDKNIDGIVFFTVSPTELYLSIYDQDKSSEADEDWYVISHAIPDKGATNHWSGASIRNNIKNGSWTPIYNIKELIKEAHHD